MCVVYSRRTREREKKNKLRGKCREQNFRKWSIRIHIWIGGNTNNEKD